MATLLLEGTGVLQDLVFPLGLFVLKGGSRGSQERPTNESITISWQERCSFKTGNNTQNEFNQETWFLKNKIKLSFTSGKMVNLGIKTLAQIPKGLPKKAYNTQVGQLEWQGRGWPSATLWHHREQALRSVRLFLSDVWHPWSLAYPERWQKEVAKVYGILIEISRKKYDITWSF